jgi:hypothetical protein
VLLSAALLAGGLGYGRLARWFGISLDVRVLMGRHCFFIQSMTNIALSAATESVVNRLHYFAVVHPLIMLVAFVPCISPRCW